MNFSIFSLISGLIALAGKIFDWLHTKDLVDAGKAREDLAALQKQVQDAQVAIAAREAVRAHIAANDGRVPDDDPFVRD